jgi:hypothetical protein
MENLTNLLGKPVAVRDIKRFMHREVENVPTATERAENAALAFDLYEDDEQYVIMDELFEWSAEIKPYV